MDLIDHCNDSDPKNRLARVYDQFLKMPKHFLVLRFYCVIENIFWSEAPMESGFTVHAMWNELVTLTILATVAQCTATHLFNAWGVLLQVPANGWVGTANREKKMDSRTGCPSTFNWNLNPSMVVADAVERRVARPLEAGKRGGSGTVAFRVCRVQAIGYIDAPKGAHWELHGFKSIF